MGKIEVETIKEIKAIEMMDIKLLANSGERLRKAVAPIIEKAKQEAYAKGKADGFEEVAKTCSECQRTQYKRGQADLIEKLKPFVAKYEGYDCVLWKIVEARASESAGDACEHVKDKTYGSVLKDGRKSPIAKNSDAMLASGSSELTSSPAPEKPKKKVKP